MNSNASPNYPNLLGDLALRMASIAERGAYLRQQIQQLQKQQELLDMQALELAAEFAELRKQQEDSDNSLIG